MAEKVNEPVIAYKGFNRDMTCKGYQYEEGKTYTTQTADVCNTGFHACEYPLDVFSYYPPGTSVYHEVQQSGEISHDNGGTKQASTEIKIGAELNICGLVKAAINYTKSRTTAERVSGNQGASVSGNRGASVSRGKSAVEKNGIAYARGEEALGVKVKGGIGSILVLVKENDNDYGVKSWKAEYVDGERIKADTWYKLKNGEFVEAGEDD